MQRTFIILAVLAVSFGTTAHAAGNGSKEETIGVGIGATVGALAGGPVGAIVGGAIGAKFGDTFHDRNRQVAELSGTLDASTARNARLQRTVSDLHADLERLQGTSRPELLALMQAGIETDLLFRTDERVLAASTAERLRALAASLAGMPDVKVRLDGYADERGAADYNATLSAERAAFVRDLLVASGVPASRIALAAHGESPAATATADSYALERRVSMTLYIEDAPSVASTP